MKIFKPFSFILTMILASCGDAPTTTEPTTSTNPSTASSSASPSPATPATSKGGSDVTAFSPVKSTLASIDPEKLPSDVFAMVNDKAITDAQIEGKMSAFINDIPPEQVTMARYNVGQGAVMEELLRQALESGQLVVSSKDLEACRSGIEKEMAENDMTLEKYLARTKMSEKDFELQVIVKAYIDSMVTPAMKDEAYAAIKDQITEGRMVSIIHKGGPAAKPEDKPGFRKSLEDVRAKAVAGETFSELAMKYSDDPNVKDNKGKCPPLFRESQMYPEIIEAAFALQKVGDVSPVVETAQGCHLLKLDSILKPQRGETHIERILMQQCGGRLMQEFMQKLRENSTVVVRKPPQPPQSMMMPPEGMPQEGMEPQQPR